MNYRHVFFIFVLGLTFVSCNSSKKLIDQHFATSNVPALINDYESYPKQRDNISCYLFDNIDYTNYSYEELQNFAQATTDPKLKKEFGEIITKRERKIIEQHFMTLNVSALIKDYDLYPKQQSLINDYLFNRIDYTSYSYEELTNFLKISNNSEIKDTYEEIVKNREEEIIEDLVSKNDLEYFCNYYKQNERQHYFLDEFITANILGNIDTLNYGHVKYYEYYFVETPYHTELHNKRNNMKIGFENQIRSDMAYIKNEEDKSIESFRSDVGYYVSNYLYGQANQIVDYFSDPQNLAGKTTEEKQNILSYLIQENISQDTINNILQEVMTYYAESIYEYRTEILESITYGDITLGKQAINNSYSAYIDANSINVGNVGKSYDIAQDIINFGLKLAGNIIARKSNNKSLSNVGNAALNVGGARVSQRLFGKKARKEMEKFKAAFSAEIDEYFYEIVNTSTMQYEEYLKSSQENFLNLYHKLY